MPRIYTEIRISHKTEEDKKKFERALEKIIKEKMYADRSNYIRDKVRQDTE